MINRREALRKTSYILGGALSASTVAAVMQGCKPATTSLDWTPAFLDNDQAEALAEICERIIPTTNTPGAKEAMADRFIDVYLQDLATPEEQKEFGNGMAHLEKISQEVHGSKFAKLSAEQMDDVLSRLAGGSEYTNKTEAEIAAEMANEGEAAVNSGTGASGQFFNKLRQLTVAGYFTSEIGAKQALVFDEIPGDYMGCIDYSEVGGTWAL